MQRGEVYRADIPLPDRQGSGTVQTRKWFVVLQGGPDFERQTDLAFVVISTDPPHCIETRSKSDPKRTKSLTVGQPEPAASDLHGSAERSGLGSTAYMPAVPADNVVQMRRGNPGKRAPVKRVKEKTPPGRPAMPSWLGAEAKAEWRRIVPALDQLGLIATVDKGLLSAYCDTWGKWMKVARALDAAEATVKPRNRGAGNVKHPLWPTYAALSAQLQSLAKELGCGPTVRARLPAPPDDDGQGEDVLDD